MEFTDDELRQFAMSTKRPIPGQSLTTNPETPWPWETPPEFTSKDEALSYFLDFLTQEERHEAILDSLEEGVPVMDLVQMFLIRSFQEGEINVNLMLLLAEPLAFMIMALGERANIENIKISEDPDDPEQDRTEYSKFKTLMKDIKEPQDDEDFNIEEKIEELPSLMERGE
jgi:hypothetical protein